MGCAASSTWRGNCRARVVLIFPNLRLSAATSVRRRSIYLPPIRSLMSSLFLPRSFPAAVHVPSLGHSIALVTEAGRAQVITLSSMEVRATPASNMHRKFGDAWRVAVTLRQQTSKHTSGV